MIYLKIRYAILAFLLFIISGCSTSGYDYTIHKPKVRFKPSLSALDRLNREALGRKYVWAEEGPYCYDCSGLTYYNFGSMGIEIPRVADAQFRNGIPVPRDQLQKGDLVFFGNGYRANHVGIYIGDGKFEHASSAKKRVIISSLDKPYYKRHYMGARRYYNFYNAQKFKPKPITPAYNTKYEPKVSVPVSQNSYKPVKNKGKYYLLVGIYKNYPSEEIMKLQLSGMHVVTNSSGGLYKVLVGPYESEAEAKKSINYHPTLLVNAKIVKIINS